MTATLNPTKTHTRERSRQLVIYATPALVYLGVRALGTLMWWAMTYAHHRFNPHPWDADWYLRIAELGYRGASTGMVDAHGVASPDGAMAFFPGYPLLVRLVATVIGHNYLAAGYLVTTLASVASAYGIGRLTTHLGGNRRAQLLAVALVAGAPMSVVFTLPYPEALVVALAVWTLVAVLERRWWLVGALVVAAGLTSPMAVPLIPVVIAAAGVDIYRERARWGAAVAAMVAMAGTLGYLLWVQATSTTGGYFALTARGWGNTIDGGATTVKWIYRVLTSSHETFQVLTAVVIIAAVVATSIVARRLPWPVAIYTGLTVLFIVVHSGLVQDRARLLLSAFPLLAYGAVRLGSTRARTAIIVTATCVLVGLWFGASSLSIWSYGI